MRNISIELKIIIAIIFFTLFIVTLERYKLSESIIEQFIESKKSQNNLLLETISPIISLNLYLGFDDANKAYLDQIIKQNSDLTLIKLVDIKGKTLYNSLKKAHNEFKKDIHNINFSTKDIVDTLSGKKLATLELYFLNKEYELVLEKNKETTIEIFAITFVLLAIFILIIKKEFRHLKELSQNVLSYDPKQSNITLTKTSRIDEVGVIHNAIVSMEEKINSHTALLDELNSSLEEKVKERTKELDELNRSLNDKISLAVKNLENKNKLILQQSRLAQMGEMISMIAHQWRQPLASISANVNNLMMKITLDKYDESYFLKRFEDIDSYTQHLSSTINDFRNFFEPSNEKKEISYKKAINDSLKIIDGSLNANKIKINKKVESENSYITYDNELKQVIINLITNAIDALIEQEVQHPEISVEALFVDDSEVLRVSDNGGGIAADILDKIFDPYFSTKKSKNGTGLGLYMSKMIIQDHCQGRLHAYNSKYGAVFEITLPH